MSKKKKERPLEIPSTVDPKDIQFVFRGDRVNIWCGVTGWAETVSIDNAISVLRQLRELVEVPPAEECCADDGATDDIIDEV